MRWGGKRRGEMREVGVKLHFFFFKMTTSNLLCGIQLLHVHEQQKCNICILIVYRTYQILPVCGHPLQSCFNF